MKKIPNQVRDAEREELILDLECLRHGFADLFMSKNLDELERLHLAVHHRYANEQIKALGGESVETLYNFNDFCKKMKCPNYIEQERPVGKCTMCSKVGFSLNIMQWPDSDCNFENEIKAAAKEAKEKDVLWKKLNNPGKQTRNEPVDITVKVFPNADNL